MTRFAMMRVVSGFINVPVATSCGAVIMGEVECIEFWTEITISDVCTLYVIRLSQKNTGLISVDNGPVNCSDGCDSRAKISFELVDIVSTFATTSRMLAVNRIYGQSPWPHAENKGVLQGLA